MTSTSNDLWATLMSIGDQMEARQKREQAAKEAAEAEAARKAPRVIASYLTVGGAHVDLTRSNDPANEKASRWDWTRATCTGCGAFDGADWNTRPYTQLITVPQAEQRATRIAREWAQSHAEKCRAMPRTA